MSEEIGKEDKILTALEHVLYACAFFIITLSILVVVEMFRPDCAEAQELSCNSCICQSCETPSGMEECDVIEEFRNGNLWKPEADHSPNGVVLIRQEYGTEFEHCEAQRKFSDDWENFRFTGFANGDRQHWRMNAPGKEYKGNKYDGYVRCKLRKKMYCFKLQHRSGVRNE